MRGESLTCDFLGARGWGFGLWAEGKAVLGEEGVDGVYGDEIEGAVAGDVGGGLGEKVGW